MKSPHSSPFPNIASNSASVASSSLPSSFGLNNLDVFAPNKKFPVGLAVVGTDG